MTTDDTPVEDKSPDGDHTDTDADTGNGTANDTADDTADSSTNMVDSSAIVNRGLAVVRDVVAIMRQKQVSLAAAGIAYYTIAALVPAVILSFVVITVVGGGEDVAQFILVTVEKWIAPEGYEMVQDILLQTRGRGGITVFGTVFLAWSVYRVLNGLEVALAQVYGHEPAASIAEQLSDFLILLIMIGLALAVTAVVGTGLTTYPRALSSGLVGHIGQFFALTILFFPLYYVLSGSRYPPSTAFPGSLVAAGGWTVLQAVYSVYVEHFTTTVYELFGGLLLFLTWLYVGVLLILVGAAVNVALLRERETGSAA